MDKVYIELYTDEKSPETESRVEAVLDEHGIFYEKSETWIESEKLYETLFKFELEVTHHAYFGVLRADNQRYRL